MKDLYYCVIYFLSVYLNIEEQYMRNVLPKVVTKYLLINFVKVCSHEVTEILNFVT